jgi:hypothetical protein
VCAARQQLESAVLAGAEQRTSIVQLIRTCQGNGHEHQHSALDHVLQDASINSGGVLRLKLV